MDFSDIVYSVTDKSKGLYEKAFSQYVFNIRPLFSKSVAGKYSKLIMSIISLGVYYQIIDVKKDTVKIRLLDVGKNPLYDWEIYQGFDNKTPRDFRKLKVTCTCCEEKCKFTITRLFHQSEKQSDMYNAMLHDINRERTERR